ncbi:MAG TPA: AAA family ATPase [Actinocrinis sp.]|nr:AAA family ATPase [Actinocrinis sp.]
MITTDRLTDIFGDAAATVLEYLDLQDRTLEVDDSVHLQIGRSGARLAVVVLSNRTDPKMPIRCIAKLSQPTQNRPSDEGRRNHAAYNSSPKDFTKNHLTELVVAPIPLPGGAQVIVQAIAGGSLTRVRPLSTLDSTTLAQACDEIRLGLLQGWVDNDYEHRSRTLAELLDLELRDSIQPAGWLQQWAADRGLLDPDHGWLETAPNEVLPNPFRLLRPDYPPARRSLTYLVGRSHGDLHSDNILIPLLDGRPVAGGFRLIDLAAFEPQAPLSRDIATLALSLIAKQAGELGQADQVELFRCIDSDTPTTTEACRRLSEIIRTLCSPQETPIEHGAWQDAWQEQMRVSFLAQALLHATYDSVGADGRRWCFRLAARLARALAADHAPDGRRPFRLDPESFANESTAGRFSSLALSPPDSRRGNPQFVDRDEQRVQLRSMLKDNTTRIITVTGPTGVGKTELVEKVLAELGWDNGEGAGHRVSRHDATDGTCLDMKAFLSVIEADGPTNPYAPGPLYRARMQLALTAYTGAPLVIIIESAEYLLDDAQSLRDPDLNETLEMLSAHSHGQVKVVLVSQRAPQAGGSASWTGSVQTITLAGLPEPDFGHFLKSLDPSAERSLATLRPSQFARVYSWLDGNPRLAELLHALVNRADRGLDAQAVPAWLARMTREEVPQVLIHELIGSLAAEQRQVVEALAAFGTAVDEPAVAALLAPNLSTGQVGEALRALEQRRIIRSAPQRRYRLPRSDIEGALRHLPPGDPDALAAAGPTRRLLLHLAAKVLDAAKKDEAEVARASDLYLHFAKLDVRLRAGRCDLAHEAIMEIDQFLRRWNQGVLLRGHREAVRGKLEDPYAEMENSAALGSLYSSLGLFQDADDSYQAALSLAKAHNAREDLRRIYIRMGQMYKNQNNTGKAREHFGYGLAIAQEEGDDAATDRSAALEGYADCARNSGRFAEAFRLGDEALRIAESVEAPRALDVALKLSRWLADVGRMKEAVRMSGRARSNAGNDSSARASCLELDAELLFRNGSARGPAGADDIARAAGLARDAVETALAQRDPLVLRQAQTTLCAIYLHCDDLTAAHREIEQVARRRGEQHSLSMVALRGLVAWRREKLGQAADLFDHLRREAHRRFTADPQNFESADLLGLALCAEAMADGGSFEPAVEAFRAARAASEPAPGLARQLKFLVGQLGRGPQQSDQLDQVRDSIT